MEISLTVVKCTEKETEKGSFITKLLHMTEAETVFGKKKAKQTFYVKGTKEFTIGEEIKINMDMFYVQEHKAKFADKDTGEMIERDLKWLHLKSSLKIA